MSHSKNTKRGFSLYINKWNQSSKKYINTCCLCGNQGFSPVILDQDFHHENPDVYSQKRVIKEELQKILKPLELDDLGRCEICAAIQNNH